MLNHARLIDILAALVAYRTVPTDQRQVGECLRYIERSIAMSGLYADRYTSNGFQSLVISTRQTLRPRVILQAHLDVVPGYEHQFKLKQNEGILYGRGVYDMKFAAACYLYLLEDLGSTAKDYDFALMLTSDEEVDGRNGVEYLLNQGFFADVCILPDSGDDWDIEGSAKGFALAEACIRGKSAHGSRPWEADNTVYRLTDLIRSVEKMFAYADHHDTTVTPTIVQAGSAFNQIPGEATVTFDIRFCSEADYQRIREEMGALAAEQGIEVKFTELAASVEHQLDNDHLKIWQDITTQKTGKVPAFTRSFAASDARYFVPHGIPTISARPKGGGHHGGGEWLSEKDFYQYYEVVKEFVLRCARPTD